MMLAIVGSRHFDVRRVRDLLVCSWPLITRTLGTPDRIVTGDAEGVDRAARELAKEITGQKAVAYKADWKNLGRAAGPVRNGQIAADSDAAVVIWDGRSRGSRDVLSKFSRKPHIEIITESP